MNDTELATLEAKVRRITRPEPQLLGYYLLASLTAFCAAPLVVIPLLFRYYTLWYRFDAQGVAMGYGVLFRRELQLTYARMQDIHLSQNIVERWLGIGTVTVQTAGSGASGNLTIVGTKDFNAIRDYLYAMMRGVRAEAHEPAAQSTDAVLVEIRDALKDAAAALGKPVP
jgi:putative membrane protein